MEVDWERRSDGGVRMLGRVGLVEQRQWLRVGSGASRRAVCVGVLECSVVAE